MATKYTNPISITSARRIEVQQPDDDRGQFETIAAITASIVADEHEGRWFEFMPTYIKEIHQFCVWLDAANLPVGITAAHLIPGTVATYPGGHPDVQYAGKTFGFYSILAVPEDHTHPEADITDLDKYTQQEVDDFLALKQNILPSNATGSVAYLTKNAADDTFSWVVFTGLSAPANTGHGYHYFGTGWRITQDPVTNPFTATTYVGGLPDKKSLLIPVFTTVVGGETYTLEDPSLIADGYNVIITHNNSPLDDVIINGYAIDYGVIPFLLEDGESVWIGVINGVWRRLDKII